jgi:hypothetical protein
MLRAAIQFKVATQMEMALCVGLIPPAIAKTLKRRLPGTLSGHREFPERKGLLVLKDLRALMP